MTSAPALTTPERAACAVCADLLATGSHWAHAGRLLVLTGVVGIAVGAQYTAVLALGIALLVLLVAGLLQQVLSVRVALDARLFDRLARGEIADLDALDAALQQLFTLPAAKLGRPLPARLAGARRLYRWQIGATLALGAANLVNLWALCA